MKKYKIINTIIITFLLMLCGSYLKSQTDPNIIDFEHTTTTGIYGSYTTADRLPVDNYFFRQHYNITFHLDGPDGTRVPKIAKVGHPHTAFYKTIERGDVCNNNNLSNFDMPAQGQNIGCYFLTDDGLPQSRPQSIYIKYHQECSQASGFIIDLDVESFKVSAYDDNGNLLQHVDLIEGMSGSGDGIATPWVIDLASGSFIDYIMIEQTYNSFDSLKGGIAFDNFSFCSIDSTISTLVQDSCCGDVLHSGCQLFDSINISTGFDPFTNSLISSGDIDPLWKLVNLPPLNCPPYLIPNNIAPDDAYCIDMPPRSVNWNNVPNAMILSSTDVPDFGCNNLISSQPWSFRRTFCVCDSAQIRITGSYRADDRGEIILRDLSNGSINAVLSRTQNPINQPPGSCWGCWTTATFDTILSLQCGTYCLDFNLVNVFAGYMGFSLNGQIVDVSGQNTLLNPSDSCCGSLSISGQKILDNNCNGIIDAIDDPGVGWSFELYDDLGNLVESAISDANGEFFFNNLTTGNYIIKEINQNGWNCSSPAGGIQNISLTSSNPFANVRFLNCRGPIDDCCDGLTIHEPINVGNCCYNIEYDLIQPAGSPQVDSCIFNKVILNPLNGQRIIVNSDIYNLMPGQGNCVANHVIHRTNSTLPTGNNQFIAQICACPSSLGSFEVEVIFVTTNNKSCRDTITLICPSTTPDICCNIDDLTISVPVLNPRVRHYGSYYGIPIKIPVSIPNSSIEEIRASIVSYNVNYSDPDCSRCYNSYIIQGTFRINNPGTLIGNLPMQSLSHYAVGTNIGNNKNGVREIVWKGMPSILGNVDIPLEIMFPSPILPKCCDVTVKACIKLVFKDADCNICEEYVCLEFDKNGIIP